MGNNKTIKNSKTTKVSKSNSENSKSKRIRPKPMSPKAGIKHGSKY